MLPKLVNCCRPEREWSPGSSTSSGEEDKRDAEIEELRAQWKKKVDWRKSGVKTLRMSMRIERNRMRRLQKDLREVEKLFVCVPKEDQNTRRSRKGHKRYKASRTKEGQCRKKMLQHKERCGRSERKTIVMRSVFGSCRTTSTRTKWWLGAELAGRERKKRQ